MFEHACGILRASHKGVRDLAAFLGSHPQKVSDLLLQGEVRRERNTTLPRLYGDTRCAIFEDSVAMSRGLCVKFRESCTA